MSAAKTTPPFPMAVPRDQDVFAAIDEFIGALGSNAVATDSEDIAGFVAGITLPPGRLTCIAAIVSPSSAEQVQAVVIIANRHRIPLWPSTGDRNHGHGLLAPCAPGSVIMDLRRMNRVLEIDEECAYAVVEPGVSFFDLYEHLRAGGYSLMMPVPELACGSVINHVLEGGSSPQPCGLEAVMANGGLVRTGMGALSASKAWHTYRLSPGPASDNLFLQTDLGIVTRMGVWLRPRPERYLSCTVRCRHDHDLALLVDTIRPFLLDGTISNHPVLFNLVSTAARIAARDEWYLQDGVIPEAELERIADETGIGRWNLRFALYGRHGVVEAQLAEVAVAFGKIAQSCLTYREYDGNAPEEDIHSGDKSQAGIPDTEVCQMSQWAGGATADYVTLSSVARLNSAEVVAQSELLRAGVEQHGFDHHGMLILSPRSVVHVICMPFDRTDTAQMEAAYSACDAMLALATMAGYGTHCPHGRYQDRIATQFAFNDEGLQGLYSLIKDAVDPNGILPSGKVDVSPAIG